MATELKLTKFDTLTRNLNQIVTHINTLALTDTAKRYVDGQPIKDINTNAVLTANKIDIAKGLPNYDTYLQAGIDLSSQIPDDEETKATIETLVKNIVGFNQFPTERSLISYDSKAGAFVVNAAGKLALDAAIVRLTPDQETAYNAVQALFTLLSAHADTLPGKIFNENLVNIFTKALKVDTMVFTITSNIK